MAYKDPEKRKAYHREYSRRRRNGGSTPRQTLIPLEMRIQTAQDVLDLMNTQVNAVLNDKSITTLECARCITYMAGTMLKAVELVEIGPRLEALEDIMQSRKKLG